MVICSQVLKLDLTRPTDLFVQMGAINEYLDGILPVAFVYVMCTAILKEVISSILHRRKLSDLVTIAQLECARSGSTL